METIFTIEAGIVQHINGKITQIPFEQIAHCRANKERTSFYDCQKQRRKLKYKLGRSFGKFNMPYFCFYRRSGFVNLHCVKEVIHSVDCRDHCLILLTNGVKLRLARRHHKPFMEIWDKFKDENG
jgi:hypothetical protein